MIPIRIMVHSLARSKVVVMDTKIVFLVSKNIVYIIKAVIGYDNNNINDDLDEKDENEEDESEDYSDDLVKEEERKDDKNVDT